MLTITFESCANELSVIYDPCIFIGCSCDPDEIADKPKSLDGYRVVYREETKEIIRKMKICVCLMCGRNITRYSNCHSHKIGELIRYKVRGTPYS